MLGNMAIRFRELPHQGEKRFEKNRLAMGAREWVDRTCSIRPIAIDETSGKISDQRTENAEEVVAC